MDNLRRAACALVAGAAALLAGCGSMGLPPSSVKLSATLSGTAEVPPNDSRGSGTLEGRYDKATRELRWRVSYLGLTGPVMAAHLHGPAMAGANAGVVVPFTGPLASPFEGSATLTPAQAQDLLDGKWYVNLHTEAHKAGEIRGQVLPAP